MSIEYIEFCAALNVLDQLDKDQGDAWRVVRAGVLATMAQRAHFPPSRWGVLSHAADKLAEQIVTTGESSDWEIPPAASQAMEKLIYRLTKVLEHLLDVYKAQADGEPLEDRPVSWVGLPDSFAYCPECRSWRVTHPEFGGEFCHVCYNILMIPAQGYLKLDEPAEAEDLDFGDGLLAALDRRPENDGLWTFKNGAVVATAPYGSALAEDLNFRAGLLDALDDYDSQVSGSTGSDQPTGSGNGAGPENED